MIPFFRKIRKKMADDNRPLKYLRYAIGEVVLVVIGILIALQINNWNENQQQKKVEISTLKALASEFRENFVSIKSCQEDMKERILLADSLRMQIGPELSILTIEDINRLIGEVGSTYKCNVSIGILEDIKGSGRLNLISNEEIRRSISEWSSNLKALEGEENDWALEFSNQFIPYSSKWILWDDIDYIYYKNDPDYYYFKSRFIIDPRHMLQKPEFSNIMAIYYW